MSTANRKPSHILTFTEARDGKAQSYSQIIGAGWAREDGSISLSLKLLPHVPGYLNLRLRKDEEDAAS